MDNKQKEEEKSVASAVIEEVKEEVKSESKEDLSARNPDLSESGKSFLFDQAELDSHQNSYLKTGDSAENLKESLIDGPSKDLLVAK